MARSARSLDFVVEQEDFLRGSFGGFGAVIARNPALVGGLTAFVVALSYVSANAIWYQPHFHNDAFFATRAHDGAAFEATPARSDGTGDATIRIEREPQPVAAIPKDPAIERVQSVLHDLGLYSGMVDGLNGPNTRTAILSYQKIDGLPQTGEVDEVLLTRLDGGPTTAGIVPRPVPAPRSAMQSAAARNQTGAPVGEADSRVTKIQAGLKAFGNEGIEIDGKVGSRTRSAILEFQTLFGLPETGEPDEQLYQKMREIGLTN
jgi:peptidoglycan hydrolase-like protein with peptidoglycan-binding domain